MGDKTGWCVVPSGTEYIDPDAPFGMKKLKRTDLEKRFGPEGEAFATIDEIMCRLRAVLGENFSYFIERGDGAKSPFTIWINETGEAPHRNCPRLVFARTTEPVLVLASIKMAQGN